jgi:hypothetical protein
MGNGQQAMGVVTSDGARADLAISMRPQPYSEHFNLQSVLVEIPLVSRSNSRKIILHKLTRSLVQCMQFSMVSSGVGKSQRESDQHDSTRSLIDIFRVSVGSIIS